MTLGNFPLIKETLGLRVPSRLIGLARQKGILEIGSPAGQDTERIIYVEKIIRKILTANRGRPITSLLDHSQRLWLWTKSPMRRSRSISAPVIGPLSRTARFSRICSTVLAPDMQTSTAGFESTKR
jgi:hypothetical protein